MTATITITMTQDGQLAVNGNIENKLMAYGMLELAKEAVAEFHKAQDRRVQPVGADSLRLLKTPS